MATDKKQPEWGLNIQKEVRNLMKKFKLSREDMASRLGVTMMTIYRWENGRTFPKSRLMIREFEKLKQELEKKMSPKNQLARIGGEGFIDLIVQKRFEEVKEKIGFSSNIFMVFGLPTHKLNGNPAYWTKETSLCKLTITAR